jgi:hypothetical protein
MKPKPKELIEAEQQASIQLARHVGFGPILLKKSCSSSL